MRLLVKRAIGNMKARFGRFSWEYGMTREEDYSVMILLKFYISVTWRM